MSGPSNQPLNANIPQSRSGLEAKKEKLIFATFTDWTSDEPKAFAESAYELWPSMKEAGAVNMRVVQTSDKGVRTMTIWPDAETALMAIQAISTVGTSSTGIEAVGGAKGAVLAEFN